MQSFIAYSENPLSAVTTNLDATAYIPHVSAVSSAGTLEYDAKAFITFPAATSTTTANDFADEDAQASLNLSSATGTTAVAFGGVANTTTLTPVTATVASGTQTANGKANIIPPAATSTFAAGTLDYDAKANITIDAATADADLTVNDFADEDAQGTATLTGVSITTNTNWDTDNGIYAVQVVYANTEFERTRTVNIVPYGNYKVYVTR